MGAACFQLKNNATPPPAPNPKTDETPEGKSEQIALMVQSSEVAQHGQEHEKQQQSEKP